MQEYPNYKYRPRKKKKILEGSSSGRKTCSPSSAFIVPDDSTPAIEPTAEIYFPEEQLVIQEEKQKNQQQPVKIPNKNSRICAVITTGSCSTLQFIRGHNSSDAYSPLLMPLADGSHLNIRLTIDNKFKRKVADLKRDFKRRRVSFKINDTNKVSSDESAEENDPLNIEKYTMSNYSESTFQQPATSQSPFFSLDTIATIVNYKTDLCNIKPDPDLNIKIQSSLNHHDHFAWPIGRNLVEVKTENEACADSVFVNKHLHGSGAMMSNNLFEMDDLNVPSLADLDMLVTDLFCQLAQNVP